MDIHVRQFAIMTIIFGVAGVLVGITTLLWSGGLSGLLHSGEETGFGAAATALVLFNMVLGPPSVLVACFLLQFQNWARNAMIVICALNVLNVPFGSILGAYGLWVLMSEETEPLFLDPGPMRRARAAAKSKGHKESATAEEQQQKRSHRIVPSKADSHS